MPGLASFFDPSGESVRKSIEDLQEARKGLPTIGEFIGGGNRFPIRNPGYSPINKEK